MTLCINHVERYVWDIYESTSDMRYICICIVISVSCLSSIHKLWQKCMHHISDSYLSLWKTFLLITVLVNNSCYSTLFALYNFIELFCAFHCSYSVSGPQIQIWISTKESTVREWVHCLIRQVQSLISLTFLCPSPLQRKWILSSHQNVTTMTKQLKMITLKV